MNVPVKEIITKVRIALNENSSADGLSFSGAMALQLDQIIKEKICDGVRMIHESAPNTLIEAKPIVVTPVKNQDGSGSIVLPTDFFRLILFKMKGWKRPVTDPIDDTSVEYSMQKNKFARGGIDKPICALTTSAAGNKILEYYSLPASQATHEVEIALYLPLPAIKTEGANEVIDISNRLYQAIVYSIAGFTLSAFNRSDEATSMFALSAKLITTDN